MLRDPPVSTCHSSEIQYCGVTKGFFFFILYMLYSMLASLSVLALSGSRSRDYCNVYRSASDAPSWVFLLNTAPFSLFQADGHCQLTVFFALSKGIFVGFSVLLLFLFSCSFILFFFSCVPTVWASSSSGQGTVCRPCESSHGQKTTKARLFTIGAKHPLSIGGVGGESRLEITW